MPQIFSCTVLSAWRSRRSAEAHVSFGTATQCVCARSPQRREFNILSNQHMRDHDQKAEAEAQRTKAELVDKFWRVMPAPQHSTQRNQPQTPTIQLCF